MRLYHFLSERWAFDDIKERHLKISKIDELNDPFELWCVTQSDQRIRKALRGFRTQINGQFGIICFSSAWSNPLLWSHYADKHRGICLGFDIDAPRVKSVRYVQDRPALNIPPTKESMEELLWTKYQDWQYEREWRGWFRLDEHDAENHYFYPFDHLIRLREIVVGPLCDVTKPRLAIAVKGYDQRVQIIKARLAFKSFRIVRNREAFRH